MTTETKSPQAIRDTIMLRAPIIITAGRTFAPKHSGRCAASGHEMFAWNQARMVQFDCWDRPMACLNGAYGVFAGCTEFGERSVAVPCKRVSAEELLEALEAGCRVCVFSDPHDSSKSKKWVAEGNRYRVSGSCAPKTRKQALRLVVTSKSFAIRIEARNEYGSWR